MTATGSAPAWTRESFRSNDFSQPHRAAFWLYLLLLIPFGVLVVRSQVTLVGRAGPLPSLVAYVLMALWAWLYIWIILLLDLFKRASASLQIAALVWGAVIAIGVAVYPNDNLFTLITRANPDLEEQWGAALIGPTTEEVIKGLGVLMIVMITGHRFRRLMDGLVYGALVGVGFAFTEDLGYMLRSGNPLDAGATLTSIGQIFGLRVILYGAFGHATYTALVGFGIAYCVVKRESPRWKRLVVLVSLFIAAWLFHFFHNGLAMTWPRLVGAPELEPVGVVTGVVNGMLGLVLAAWLYVLARRDENGWFRSAVADDIGTDLITAREVDALSTLTRRRRARKAARKGGGQSASRLVAELQKGQIAYALAKERSTPGSPELDPPRQRIREARRSLSALPGLSVEGA